MIEVNLQQTVVDIDFTNFCVCYTHEGLVNLLL